ncbi:MAG: hypothetical protein ACREB6_05560 [Rhodospirillales bacterium]
MSKKKNPALGGRVLGELSGARQQRAYTISHSADQGRPPLTVIVGDKVDGYDEILARQRWRQFVVAKRAALREPTSDRRQAASVALERFRDTFERVGQ